uniref:Uncharacterized protein n=1 Tax=Sphaerodactylus townsendi TaxID=933632 RepID=A0ACB8FIS2_9SAUR
MEAALLQPLAAAEVKAAGSVSAELEVKKLQELVRQLEKQNEQLRSRAAVAPIASPTPAPVGPASPRPQRLLSPAALPVQLAMAGPAPALLCVAAAAEPFVYFKPSPVAPQQHEAANLPPATAWDEVEVLDLQGEPEKEAAEETWLYVVPAKSGVSQEKLLSPLQWCRRVLDHPSPEIEAAKRSLCFRLEQAMEMHQVSWLFLAFQNQGYKFDAYSDLDAPARRQADVQ